MVTDAEEWVGKPRRTNDNPLLQRTRKPLATITRRMNFPKWSKGQKGIQGYLG